MAAMQAFYKDYAKTNGVIPVKEDWNPFKQISSSGSK